MKKRFKLMSLFLAFIFTFSFISLDTWAEEGKWYTDAAKYVINNGIMENLEEEFKPNDEVSRFTLYQSFYAIEKGLGELDEVLNWSKEIGLYKGEDFKAEENITRLEMFETLYNYMQYKNITSEDGKLEDYLDLDEVSEKDMPIIEYLVGSGIVEGKGNNLDLNTNAKRAELAKIHYYLSKFFNKETTGAVKLVDKYGNITLDLLTQNLLNAGFEFGDILTVKINEQEIEAPFGTGYSDVDTGSEIVRAPKGFGANKIIIAVNMGNFSTTYNVKEGDKVEIEIKEKAGYRTEWEIRQLKRTNNREDYSTDEIFANFRNVQLGNMGKGIYYRSSSPINNELGRASYSDELIKESGIKTVINLADNEEEIKGYIEAEDFNSPYYKELYDNGNVILLDMGVDFQSDDFKAKLKEGLKFMIDNEGPYLVHCTEGKDRAGFVAGLLEALMGATPEEIKEDYMISFVNYYNVEHGSEQYEKIAESNILTSLKNIANLPKDAELSEVDLEKAAEDYLIGIGLTKEEVKLLKDKLSKDIITELPNVA